MKLVLRIAFLVSCVGILLSPRRAHADWRLILVPEFLSSANIDRSFKDDARDAASAFPGSSASIKSTGGYGIRVGMMTQFTPWKNTYVGGSLGYIVGPKVTWTVDDPSNGSFGAANRQYYTRTLAEGVHLIPLSSRLAFKLGAGLGVAKGTTKQQSFGSGNFTGETSKRSHSEVGFTCEISPALVINLDATVLELGLRYMQFPTIKETDQTTKVEWTPFGFYIGLGF